MYNEELYKRTKRLCGSWFVGEVRGEIEESVIRQCEEKIGVTFPNSYVEFLKKFGAGGICGSYIYGIESEEHASVWRYTKEFRKKRIIRKAHIVVIHAKSWDGEWIICLDTSRMVDGECPAIKCIIKDDKLESVSDYAADFWEVFDKDVEEVYLERGVPRELEAAGENRDLPSGMGFGCSWMVVEGASKKAIIEALIQGKTKKYDYTEGLQEVADAEPENNIVAITATYKKQNCIIGEMVHRFFYQQEAFLEKLKDFSRVYIYMTEHVSETHGFALIENGKIVRLFVYDEEHIQNVGEPLPEEIALEYCLPKSYEDVWRKEEEFTKVNEDMIVDLAVRQVGIDVEQYPYKQVTLGVLGI